MSQATDYVQQTVPSVPLVANENCHHPLTSAGAETARDGRFAALETVPPLPPESETQWWQQPARLDEQFMEAIGESRSHVGEGLQGPVEFRDHIVTAVMTLHDDTLRVRVRV